MAAAHNRRLDYITFELDGENYECQLTNWKLNPPTNIGDKVYTYCPDGEFREAVDQDDWTLDLSWVTDWRVAGLDRILHANVDEELAFVLVNHPTVTGEKVSWAGTIIVKAPATGGEPRTTEMSEMTFTGVGDFPSPTYPV